MNNCFNIATVSIIIFFLSSSLVEERHGSPARLPVPAPGWGKPHPEVDAEPAHQRHAGRLRPREEVPADTSAFFFTIGTVKTFVAAVNFEPHPLLTAYTGTTR